MYITSDPTHPSKYFDGEWTQIKDKFILAAGDKYAVGTEGGEAEVTLTVQQMPSHNHTIDVPTYIGGAGNAIRNSGADQGGPWPIGVTTNLRGGSQPHNNMPPFKTYYVWERVA